MTDNSQLELVAEDQVSIALRRSEIYVAKPKFDLDGTDLLAFRHFEDGSRYFRIQAKGRTVPGASAITTQKEYVRPGYVLFLYLQDSSSFWLYCFLHNDIKTWDSATEPRRRSPDVPVYRQNISNQHQTDLAAYEFTDNRRSELLNYLEVVEETGDIHDIFFASAHLTMPAVRMKAHGTVTPPSKE